MKVAVEVESSRPPHAASDAQSRAKKPGAVPEPTMFSVDLAERFIDVTEAAAFIGLHRRTLLRLAREGSIPAHPLTGRRRRIWRFLISELDAWGRSRVNSGCDRCQTSRSK